MPPARVQISVRLPLDVLNTLDDYAKARDVGRTVILESAARQYLGMTGSVDVTTPDGTGWEEAAEDLDRRLSSLEERADRGG